LLPLLSNSSRVYGLWMFMDVSPVYSRYIMVYHGISWYIEVVNEGF
jgi:hypothetical protein